jgi:hypothetical protein
VTDNFGTARSVHGSLAFDGLASAGGPSMGSPIVSNSGWRPAASRSEWRSYC